LKKNSPPLGPLHTILFLFKPGALYTPTITHPCKSLVISNSSTVTGKSKGTTACSGIVCVEVDESGGGRCVEELLSQ